MGTRDRGSQWCNRLLTKDQWVRWSVFCLLGKGKRAEEGSVVPKVATEETHKAKGRTLVLLQLRHTHNAPSPRKLTFYLTHLWFHRRWVDMERKGYSVIKRIGLLMVAALMAAMMMVATAAPAFAVTTDKQCKGGNPNCVLTGPGKSETSNAVNGGNPNIAKEFTKGNG